tara:strand:- start:304 stop:465 length:162 start_codon:yes stop_codon:yes gene_type:complete
MGLPVHQPSKGINARIETDANPFISIMGRKSLFVNAHYYQTSYFDVNTPDFVL